MEAQLRFKQKKTSLFEASSSYMFEMAPEEKREQEK